MAVDKAGGFDWRHLAAAATARSWVGALDCERHFLPGKENQDPSDSNSIWCNIHSIEGLLNQIDIIFIAELVETLWFAMNPDEAAITNLAGAVFL